MLFYFQNRSHVLNTCGFQIFYFRQQVYNLQEHKGYEVGKLSFISDNNIYLPFIYQLAAHKTLTGF